VRVRPTSGDLGDRCGLAVHSMRKGAFALDFYRKSPLALNRTV
jgi:hypothetical protein